MLSSQGKNIMRYTLFLRQLSQKDECEDVQRMDKMIDFLQQRTFQTYCNNKSNLTKPEWKDLLALKNNSKLIIKKADKGSCMVLMNKPHYKKMIFQHLNDANTYLRNNKKM